MKLNLNFNLKGLDGNEIPNTNAGKLLAEEISRTNQGNSIKLFDWAVKLWNENEIELDSTDAEVLKALIEKSTNLTVLSKAQLLRSLQEEKK
jgi:hypothetical protein